MINIQPSVSKQISSMKNQRHHSYPFKTSSLLTIFFLLFTISPSLAQKVSNEKLSIAYIQLPRRVLPDDIGTYKLFIALGSEQFYGYVHPDEYTPKFRLYGFEPAEDPDLEVTLNLMRFDLLEKEVVTHEHKRKDKKTKQETTYYTYSYSLTYRLPATYRVRTYDGKVVMRRELSKQDHKLYTSTDDFDSQGKLLTYWRDNQREFLAETQRKRILKYVESLHNQVNNELGYVPKRYTHKVSVVSPKRKSTFNYDKYPQAFEQLKRGYADRRSEDITTGNESMKAAVELWKQEIAELDLEDKKARITEKIASDTYVNCAWACVWMFQFDIAEAYLAKADELKGAKGKAKDVQKAINYLRVRYQLQPEWKGERQIVARKGTSILLNDPPDKRTQLYNQRYMAQQNASSVATAASSPGMQVGVRKQSALGEVVGLVTNIINSKDQKSQQNQTLTQNTVPLIYNYQQAKSAQHPDFKQLSPDQRSTLLTQHGWKMVKLESVDGTGQTHALPASEQNACLFEGRHFFTQDQQYRIEHASCSAAEGVVVNAYSNMPDWNSLTISVNDELITYRIINLSEHLLELETTTHSQDKPLMRLMFVAI